MPVEEFHYQVPWRVRGSHPGHHRSGHSGGGFESHGHAPLLRAPDPRRFDIRASLRDPFEELMVRVYHQRSRMPVYALADLSASMAFGGHCRKLDVLADFTAALGYSAYRTGDLFGFIGCDSAIRTDFLQPLTSAKGAGAALSQRLHAFRPAGSDSQGLLAAAPYLTKQRALVFLVSDFHFPLPLLGQVLAPLSQHAVVPVVLWDRAEFDTLPRFGIARLQDWETGRQRTLLLRPAVREKIRRAFTARREALTQFLRGFGLTPLFIMDHFQAEAVTRYFYT